MGKFDDEIEGLMRVGDLLIPYNYPQDENDEVLSSLKKTFLEVDGYSVGIHYNKADYETYFMETVQIFGITMPFLPFNLVLKIARRMLGSSYLSYIQLPEGEHKYYCWTVCLDRAGRPIKHPYGVKTAPATFEGFEYTYMHVRQFNY